MKKFIIEEPFWEIFPEAKIGILVCRGITNQIVEEDRYKAYLEQACREAKQYVSAEEFTDNPVIRRWRDAFYKFKTKKGARCSIEALLKRISKGGEIGTINPLVDIYNGISLKYGVPVGGEDIDKFVGDNRLTLADGGEEFITYGSDKSEPPYAGEVVYKDEAGTICRCFNWRESVRTMLTEETTNAFMCIETVAPEDRERMEAALEELKERIESDLGGRCSKYILDRENSQVVIEEEETLQDEPVKEVTDGAFVTLHLHAKLQPTDRGDIYEDRLDAILGETGLGSVDGGGTLVDSDGEIESCDVEITLHRREDLDKLQEIVNAMCVPKGSLLQPQWEADRPVGNLEGMAVYFNGTELADEVYQQCDINEAISQMEKLMEGQGAMYSYWEGSRETAIYFYGDSFEKMKESILQFTREYPLCEKCRIVRIA